MLAAALALLQSSSLGMPSDFTKSTSPDGTWLSGIHTGQQPSPVGPLLPSLEAGSAAAPCPFLLGGLKVHPSRAPGGVQNGFSIWKRSRSSAPASGHPRHPRAHHRSPAAWGRASSSCRPALRPTQAGSQQLPDQPSYRLPLLGFEMVL